MSPAELGEDENEDVQFEYFGEAFAARAGFFVNLYERFNARRTARALKLGRRSRVLEIGPGSGAVMGWLASLGHDVRGLDLSPTVARQIERRRNLPVAVEPLDVHIHSVGECIYDAIVMRHVLEHFTDPFDVLQGAHALLKPGGKLYIAVPNMDSWHRHFAGWSGYEPYHVHYFGQRSLACVLSRVGFRVARVASYEPLTGWANTLRRSVVSQVRSERSAQASKGEWKRQALETVRLATGVLLSPIRWLQSSLNRGEELTAVAEKVAG